MKSLNQLCLTAAGAVSLLTAVTCDASVVYEAKYTSSGSQPYFGSSLPYGDEIVLAGTDRVATEFSFAYFSTYDLAGGLSLSFYNNGPGTDAFGHPAPTAPAFFTWTGDITKSDTGIDVSIPFALDPSNPLPDSFTYVVQFAGESANNPAGLLLADSAASVGFSYDDFWIDDAWELNVIPGHIANFEASLSAVPEASPGAVAAIGLATLGVFAGYRRMQRK